jgi:LAS superfamily LD-carboxypeptidase LdcB
MPAFSVAGATRAPVGARLASLVVLAVTALLLPTLVDAAPAEDPRAERERVQAERAQAAAELDAAQADFEKVRQALVDLEVRAAAVEARLEDAERAYRTAEDAATSARAAETETIARIRGLEAEVQESAIDAYISPLTEATAGRVPVDDLTEQALRDALVDLQTGRSNDLLDQLDVARADLADQRRRAEAAANEAKARRTEVAARKAELDEAQQQFQGLAQDVEDRINHLAGEVESLARQDEELAAQIAEEQAVLAAAVPAGLVTASPAITSGPVSTTVVGGIEVNSSIAGQIEALLNAARTDGVVLTGSGFRNPAEQIALRRAHCGSSNYAVYQAPSSSCSPPTAVPGTSNHEQGLAIDFKNCSRGSACFSWLSGNAGRFGMFNLPSESWHWSTTGN